VMRERWGDLLDVDPAYSPNLTLTGRDFTLAEAPRVEPVWTGPTREASHGHPSSSGFDIAIQ